MPRYQRGLSDQMVDAADVAFTGFNNYLRPDQLPAGMLSKSENGRIGGTWQTRPGIDVVSTPISGGDRALTLPFYLYESVVANSVTRVGDTFTMNFDDASSFNDDTIVGISGITGILPDPNGNRRITSVTATQITFEVPGADGTIGGTGVAGSPYIDTDSINAVYGSCPYSDPNDLESSYIIIAGNIKAFAIDVTNQTVTSIEYPGTEFVAQPVDMVQFNEKVFIFREGKIALEWDGDLTAETPAFTLVANGDYEQPSLYNSLNNTTIQDGQVTVSEPGHTFKEGDRVYVVETGTTDLSDAAAASYTVESVPEANSFTFRAIVDDVVETTCSYMKRQSVGLGFTHMPCPPWAVPFQYRLVMPFRYTQSGESGSAVITDRKIRDELIVSDILDTDTYDQVYAQFRFSPGTSDYLVGVLGFADDKVVVFNRNSIHLVLLSGADAEAASSQLLTTEVGLSARKSVQQIGDQIIFLSDNGVYGASFKDLYNLRGNSVPMSQPIQNTIDMINKDYAHLAVSAYFNNRYYLAVPLNKYDVNGVLIPARKNNVILVFNFLNNSWESVDVVDNADWEITNLLIAGNGDVRAIYALNQFGGVHKIDARTDDRDRVTSRVGAAPESIIIKGEAHTRGFNLNSMERKKWNSMELHVESSNDNTSDLTIDAEFENSDSEASYGSIYQMRNSALPAGEDASFRVRMGNRRAYSSVIKLRTIQGRPKLRAVRVRGATSFRSQLRAE